MLLETNLAFMLESDTCCRHGHDVDVLLLQGLAQKDLLHPAIFVEQLLPASRRANERSDSPPPPHTQIGQPSLGLIQWRIATDTIANGANVHTQEAQDSVIVHLRVKRGAARPNGSRFSCTLGSWRIASPSTRQFCFMEERRTRCTPPA